MANVTFLYETKHPKSFNTLIGTTLTTSSPDTKFEGVWISSNLFGVDRNGSENISWTILEFVNKTHVHIYDVHLKNKNMVSGTIPGKSTTMKVIEDLTPQRHKYTGTIPKYSINSVRDKINKQEEEFYQTYGSNIDSLQSNYQSTLMAGIVVAMFGTTVLFFTFRQL